MVGEDEIVCTTVNEDMEFEQFSRAHYLVLIRGGVIIHREVNPALNSINKRPVVARRCVELGATTVLAPHGSLCYPSYLILRRSGVKIYVARPGDKLGIGVEDYARANAWEVMYSSLLAIKERVEEVLHRGK